ncbi:hypothetical protein KO481_27820 [Nocardia sp. NEAU-G5]|uniref:Uncharacterized protein n=1 Tax=Nocardia albiluteola TaxID=2842303 RepID=A0ABS6B7Z3_9NOCA|nr:DUF6328 family protein [Nocardia albiluteola]MBU3065323.1 hypothetical protein [Nocardia albiluteola]
MVAEYSSRQWSPRRVGTSSRRGHPHAEPSHSGSASIIDIDSAATISDYSERSYSEILQEIRVAQGVGQAVVAFQLGLGFTSRFGALGTAQRSMYVIMLVLSVTSIALLVAPILYRQLTFRHQPVNPTIAASRCVLAGMAMLMCSIVASLLFALFVVCSVRLAVAVGVVAFAWFVICWFAYPMWARSRLVQLSRHRR